jgi:hypothetical protein
LQERLDNKHVAQIMTQIIDVGKFISFYNEFKSTKSKANDDIMRVDEMMRNNSEISRVNLKEELERLNQKYNIMAD